MSSTRILSSLVLIFILIIKLNNCNAASVPEIGNNTEENTAIAKSSPTVLDVFEDIRWFFERLTTFCDIIERMLPPEKKEREEPQLSVGQTLQLGFRHFIFGVREISKSIVRVVSDKEVREYKQLSRATDFAHDLLKSVGEFFRNLRLLVSNLFAAYTFYIPEVVLTKCMGNYLLDTYPKRHFYEYPILLINDIIDAFRTPTNFKGDPPQNTTGTSRKLEPEAEIIFDKNMEQNEILDEDMYVFHNTPVSPSPELTVKEEEIAPQNESSPFNFDIDLDDPLGLKEKLEANPTRQPPSWKRCVQMYATESIFRKLEFYLFLKKQ